MIGKRRADVVHGSGKTNYSGYEHQGHHNTLVFPSGREPENKSCYKRKIFKLSDFVKLYRVEFKNDELLNQNSDRMISLNPSISFQ